VQSFEAYIAEHVSFELLFVARPDNEEDIPLSATDSVELFSTG